MNERLEMAIEALCMAHDREMARHGFGCSPWDDEDEDAGEAWFPEDYMEDRHDRCVFYPDVRGVDRENLLGRHRA